MSSNPTAVEDYFIGLDATIYVNGLRVGYIRQVAFTITQEIKRYNPLGRTQPIFRQSMRYGRFRLEGAYWDNKLLALAMGTPYIDEDDAKDWREKAKDGSLSANSEEAEVFFRYKNATIQVSITAGGHITDSDAEKRTLIISDLIPDQYQINLTADGIVLENVSGYAMSWNFINNGV